MPEPRSCYDPGMTSDSETLGQPQPPGLPPMMVVPAPQVLVSEAPDKKGVRFAISTAFGITYLTLSPNSALRVAAQARKAAKACTNYVVTRSGGPNGAVLLDKPPALDDREGDDVQDEEDA